MFLKFPDGEVSKPCDILFSRGFVNDLLFLRKLEKQIDIQINDNFIAHITFEDVKKGE